jgi:hypothetical protein
MEVFNTEAANANTNILLPQHPFRMICSGPSNCGKTNWLLNLVMNPEMPWESVHLFYGAEQPKYEILEKYLNGESVGEDKQLTKKQIKKMKAKGSTEGNIPFEKFKGMPSEAWLSWFNQPDRREIPALIILDDLMLATEKSNDINKLFTIGSHHCNASVINLCQTIFTNKLQRNNSDYYVIFNFDQDMGQVSIIFRQLEPIRWRELLEEYKKITDKPYSWFMIDLRCKNLGHPHLKYRANAFDNVLLFGPTPGQAGDKSDVE